MDNSPLTCKATYGCWTVIQGQGSFTKRGLLRGDTACNVKGVQHIYTKFSKCNSFQVTSDFTHYGRY